MNACWNYQSLENYIWEIDMSNLMAYSDDIRRGGILSVQFNLLNRCTSRCSYCRKYTWPDEQLELSFVKRTLRYLKERGLQSVTLSGGDPILYNDLIELLKFCNILNIPVNLITTLITKDTKVLNAISRYVHKISVSIDAVDEDVYYEARGVKNVLRLITNNLKYVNKLREEYKLKKVRFSSTISKINASQVYKIYEFAKSTNSKVRYYFMHDYNEYQMNESELQACKAEFEKVASEDAGITNALVVLQNMEKGDVNIESKICRIPFIHAIIDANGDIYPCCKLMDDNGEYGAQKQYSYGNIKDADLDSQFANRFKTVYDICGYCKGCWDRYKNKIDDVNKLYLTSKEVLFL